MSPSGCQSPAQGGDETTARRVRQTPGSCRRGREGASEHRRVGEQRRARRPCGFCLTVTHIPVFKYKRGRQHGPLMSVTPAPYAPELC